MNAKLNITDDNMVTGCNIECNVKETFVLVTALNDLWNNDGRNLLDRMIARAMAEVIKGASGKREKE